VFELPLNAREISDAVMIAQKEFGTVFDDSFTVTADESEITFWGQERTIHG
jgi:hypothetical protein